MDRMLRYSLERGKAIRVMWMDESGMRQALCTVVAIGDDTVTVESRRPRGTIQIRKADLLSADYRKGDEGQSDD